MRGERQKTVQASFEYCHLSLGRRENKTKRCLLSSTWRSEKQPESPGELRKAYFLSVELGSEFRGNLIYRVLFHTLRDYSRGTRLEIK